MEPTHQKITCPACGTSPVNHSLLLFSDIMDFLINKLNNVFFSFVDLYKHKELSNMIEKFIFELSILFHIMSLNDDIEKACTGRSKLIWEEAQKRGIKMQQLKAFGKPIEFYRAIINGKKFYFQSLPIPTKLEQSGYYWLDDKFILHEKLGAQGINAPKSYKVYNLAQALDAFEKLEKPVIIKPQNGSRGRHTTTNIKTRKELELAYRLAREITLFAVVQEHVFGSVYRATVINNKLVGFFRADPPKITGDGISSINKLIEKQHKDHVEKLSDITINEDLLSFIERQGYNLDSILEKDKTIDLSAKTGRFYGGYTEEMLPKIHPRLHEIFKKAGEIVEAPVVGFDVIMIDPTKDPKDQRWGIIECNSLPFIDLHYFALVGKPINLAENIWDLWK